MVYQILATDDGLDCPEFCLGNTCFSRLGQAEERQTEKVSIGSSYRDQPGTTGGIINTQIFS